VLNDRVADAFKAAASDYADVELLRTDDPTGVQFQSIAQRTEKANIWGADLYLDMHHNAGIDLGSGGGVTAFSFPGSETGARYRDAIYQAVVSAGGLQGNRKNPLQEKEFDSLRLTKMPAVLIEYGFFDSTTDYPVLSDPAYSKAVGIATMEAVAQIAGLTKRTPTDNYSLSAFVRDVQQAIGAAVDGIAGSETLSKTPTVSAAKNNTHPVVLPMQKRLVALGYTQVGEADGIAGSLFTAALTAFQRDNGCWRDGEATARNKTWRKLLGM
jgi:peptidoglycan hydrolase-like protein with peptidoglycan-binding domain